MGRMQADLTGRRLAIMAKGLEGKFGPCNITAIRTSGMTRAKETAEIIAKHLPDIEMVKSDPMLNEAL
jgi:broad specificity phosphatase PhoE